MECREVRQLAEAFISEQLLVETTHAIVAHLDRCPACRAEVDGLRRLRAATRSAFANMPELTPRPEFLSVLTGRLQAESARQQPSRWKPWLALAASTLLVAGTGWAFREWSLTNLSTLLYAAVGDHRFCALDFKLAEAPITLKMSGSFSPSALSRMLCTWTSLNQPLGNRGRMGRSVRRQVRISRSKSVV